MYEELIEELRQHHCDAKEDDTQEVCEECAYDVIIADKSAPSGIASVCVCGLMNRAANAIEELQKQLREEKVDNINLTGWLAEEHAKHLWISVTERLPENGTHVLASCRTFFNNYGYVCDAFYVAPKSMEVSYYDDYPSDCETEYDEEEDKYFLVSGWYEVIKNWDDYNSIAIEDKVTHWMPLPQPPKDGES